MTPNRAKALTVDRRSSQDRVLVQIELANYLGSFHTLNSEYFYEMFRVH
jgi:hypothetical protein